MAKNMKNQAQCKTIYYLREIEAVYKPSTRSNVSIKITCSDDVVRWFCDLQDKSCEHFIVLYLNSPNNIICYSEFTGGLDSCSVDQRVIFQHALLCGATGIILLHNHPSGNNIPSSNDIEITKNICSSGKCLGIKVLDHIIIAGDSHYSFAVYKLI